MLRPSTLTLGLLLLFASPALAWEANVVERENEMACLILPDDFSFAVEMAETDEQQRRTRIYIPRTSGLPGGSRYFIALHDRKGIQTKDGMIEGSGAAQFVFGMLDSPRVSLGYSRGTRPLETRHSLSTDGFSDEFWNCMRYLGWHGDGSARPPAAEPPRPPAKPDAQAMATAVVENADPPDPPEALALVIAEYQGLAGQKALAVAIDPDERPASGHAHGAPTIEEAIVAALESCDHERSEKQIGAECFVHMVGEAIVGHLAPTAHNSETSTATDQEPTRRIQYDTRWVEGRQFIVGTAKQSQVWAAFSTEGGPHAFLYLVNADSSGHTFFPEEVRAVAVRRTAAGDHLVPMETFSAEGYEQKEQRKRALIGALYGVATAFANVPTPTTSTVQGFSHGHVSAFGSGGYVTGQSSGSFSGTITTWPTARDHADARARTAAQVAAMNAHLQTSFDAMAATLARRHTLPPDSFYGGIVRFRKERGHQYRLAIPFAGETFELTFDVQ